MASQVLDKIPRAGGAGYDSERSNGLVRCMDGTRTTILEKISYWLDRPVPGTVEPIYGSMDLLESGSPLSPVLWLRTRTAKTAHQLAQSCPAAKPMIVKFFSKIRTLLRSHLQHKSIISSLNPFIKSQPASPIRS